MKFTVVTLFPELISEVLKHGVVGQGLEKKLFEVETVNPRLFATDNHKTVDDRPFGGGDGMVLQPEIVEKSVAFAKEQNAQARVLFLSPQGTRLTEEKVQELAQHKSFILLAGRYAGLDQRAINEFVDEEISIGDYVLSGGELPALVLIEALTRKLEGVLGHADSATNDSFANDLLEAPLFTRPRQWQDKAVPEILLSGDHQAISSWREKVSWLVTLQKRPDLFKKALTKKLQTPLKKKSKPFIEELKEFDAGFSASERKLCGLWPSLEERWHEVMGGL